MVVEVNMCELSSLPTVEGEPVTHRESGPVYGSGSTGECGAGAQTQGSCVQGRPDQAADGKNCSLYEMMMMMMISSSDLTVATSLLLLNPFFVHIAFALLYLVQ